MQNIRVPSTARRELQCEVEGVKFIQFPSASGCPSVANDARTNRLWKKLSQREEEALTLLIVWGDSAIHTHGYCLRGRRGRGDADGHNRSKGPCPLTSFRSREEVGGRRTVPTYNTVKTKSKYGRKPVLVAQNDRESSLPSRSCMQEEERSARCKYRFAVAETRVLRPRKEKERKEKTPSACTDVPISGGARKCA